MKTGVTAEVKKAAVVEEEEVPLMLMGIAEAKKEVAVVVEEGVPLMLMDIATPPTTTTPPTPPTPPDDGVPFLLRPPDEDTTTGDEGAEVVSKEATTNDFNTCVGKRQAACVQLCSQKSSAEDATNFEATVGKRPPQIDTVAKVCAFRCAHEKKAPTEEAFVPACKVPGATPSGPSAPNTEGKEATGDDVETCTTKRRVSCIQLCSQTPSGADVASFGELENRGKLPPQMNTVVKWCALRCFTNQKAPTEEAFVPACTNNLPVAAEGGGGGGAGSTAAVEDAMGMEEDEEEEWEEDDDEEDDRSWDRQQCEFERRIKCDVTCASVELGTKDFNDPEVCKQRCKAGLQAEDEAAYVTKCVDPRPAERAARRAQQLKDNPHLGLVAPDDPCHSPETAADLLHDKINSLYRRSALEKRVVPPLWTLGSRDDARDARVTNKFAMRMGGDTAESGCRDSEGTFSEYSMHSMLEALSDPAVNMTSADRFLYVGSGTGKLVQAVAHFVKPRRATGVESGHGRWEASCRALDNLRALEEVELKNPTFAERKEEFWSFAKGQGLRKTVEFIRADATTVDMRPYTVVLMSTACFRDSFVHRLAYQVRHMRVGSKIIVASFPGLPAAMMRGALSFPAEELLEKPKESGQEERVPTSSPWELDRLETLQRIMQEEARPFDRGQCDFERRTMCDLRCSAWDGDVATCKGRCIDGFELSGDNAYVAPCIDPESTKTSADKAYEIAVKMYAPVKQVLDAVEKQTAGHAQAEAELQIAVDAKAELQGRDWFTPTEVAEADAVITFWTEKVAGGVKTASMLNKLLAARREAEQAPIVGAQNQLDYTMLPSGTPDYEALEKVLRERKAAFVKANPVVEEEGEEEEEGEDGDDWEEEPTGVHAVGERTVIVLKKTIDLPSEGGRGGADHSVPIRIYEIVEAERRKKKKKTNENKRTRGGAGAKGNAREEEEEERELSIAQKKQVNAASQDRTLRNLAKVTTRGAGNYTRSGDAEELYVPPPEPVAPPPPPPVDPKVAKLAEEAKKKKEAEEAHIPFDYNQCAFEKMTRCGVGCSGGGGEEQSEYTVSKRI